MAPLCKWQAKGHCKYGPSCRQSHDVSSTPPAFSRFGRDPQHTTILTTGNLVATPILTAMPFANAPQQSSTELTWTLPTSSLPSAPSLIPSNTIYSTVSGPSVIRSLPVNSDGLVFATSESPRPALSLITTSTDLSVSSDSLASSPLPPSGSESEHCPGTMNTNFKPFIEKDTDAKDDVYRAYQTIILQPPCHLFSPEELRLVDYARGRRYALGYEIPLISHQILTHESLSAPPAKRQYRRVPQKALQAIVPGNTSLSEITIPLSPSRLISTKSGSRPRLLLGRSNSSAPVPNPMASHTWNSISAVLDQAHYSETTRTVISEGSGLSPVKPNPAGDGISTYMKPEHDMSLVSATADGLGAPAVLVPVRFPSMMQAAGGETITGMKETATPILQYPSCAAISADPKSEASMPPFTGGGLLPKPGNNATAQLTTQEQLSVLAAPILVMQPTITANALPKTDTKKAPKFQANDMMVTFLIGNEKKRFKVHRSFAIHYSPVLNAAFTGPFKYTLTYPPLEHITEEVFSLFIDWIYKQTIPKIEEDVERGIYGERLLRLWILGEAFQLPQLQDQAIEMHKKNGSLDKLVLKVVYENTVAGSPLRGYIVHEWIWEVEASDICAGEVDIYPKDFLMELCVALKGEFGYYRELRDTSFELSKNVVVEEG